MIVFLICVHVEISWMQAIGDWFGLFDIYTNFVCVVLCYQDFKKYYMTLCGIIDSKCNLCWNYLIVPHQKQNNHKTNKTWTKKENVNELQDEVSTELSINLTITGADTNKMGPIPPLVAPLDIDWLRVSNMTPT
eukprot:344055_1